MNLGIGIPALVPSMLPKNFDVTLQGENGMLGLKGFPKRGQEDPDLIDPSKQTITADQGASYSSSSEAFGLVRGSHLYATFLGTMEVSESGDLANWIIPKKLVKGMGGAMDLVASGSKLVVLTEHNTKNGKPKILKKCSLPLTGLNCVSKIITELAVFEVRPHQSLLLTDIYEGIDITQLREKTEAQFEVSSKLKSFI